MHEIGVGGIQDLVRLPDRAFEKVPGLMNKGLIWLSRLSSLWNLKLVAHVLDTVVVLAPVRDRDADDVVVRERDTALPRVPAYLDV